MPLPWKTKSESGKRNGNKAGEGGRGEGQGGDPSAKEAQTTLKCDGGEGGAAADSPEGKVAHQGKQRSRKRPARGSLARFTADTALLAGSSGPMHEARGVLAPPAVQRHRSVSLQGGLLGRERHPEATDANLSLMQEKVTERP